MTELRKMQVEEIARVTGVPRPLLMVDETSWGSGIQALGQFFVQYALNPWFEAWQQAAERSLLVGDEKNRFAVKFNPNALLRGSTKDQGDFFAKALGAGGQPGWMSPNEVRRLNDMPEHADPASNQISKGNQGGSPAPDDDGGDDAPA
jgi:HK97 family phage portal protein